MRVLIDTNIMLDFLSKRPSFFKSADSIIQLCCEEKVQGFIAAHSVVNAFYILRKEYSEETRKEILSQFTDLVPVVEIDHTSIKECLLNGKYKDLEDCLQENCAKKCQADYIITRDPSGFSESKIPAVSPDRFLQVFTGTSSN